MPKIELPPGGARYRARYGEVCRECGAIFYPPTFAGPCPRCGGMRWGLREEIIDNETGKVIASYEL